MKKPNKGKGKPILTTVFTQTKLNNSYSILIDNEGKILGIDLPNSVDFDDKKKELAFQKVKSTSIKTNLHDSLNVTISIDVFKKYYQKKFNYLYIDDDAFDYLATTMKKNYI